jgi:hypothetical protein
MWHARIVAMRATLRRPVCLARTKAASNPSQTGAQLVVGQIGNASVSGLRKHFDPQRDLSFCRADLVSGAFWRQGFIYRFFFFGFDCNSFNIRR